VISDPAPAPPAYYWDAAALNAPADANRGGSSIFVFKLRKE